MNKVVVISATLAIIMLNSSCAMIKKLSCTASSASRTAQEDVSNGFTDMPGMAKAKNCEEADFKPAQYETEYRRAYEAKKTEICQVSNAGKFGYEEGVKGTEISKISTRYNVCKSMNESAKIEKSFQTSYQSGYCSSTRAEKVGLEIGKALKSDEELKLQFNSCSDQTLATARNAFKKGTEEAMRARTEEFLKSTGTASLNYQGKGFTAACRVAADKSKIEVEVNNPNPEQMLIQGQWKFNYYNSGFDKIADDQMQEAVLVQVQSKKIFSKLTLPRDAVFCRSEM